MKANHLTRIVASAVLGLAISNLWSLDARAAVGRTDAAYGVTQNGAATYTIPVRATEGINGMTPHLAISYVGPGTRSIFGVGFALSGISYITPCRKTIAQDLNAAPITLTSTDRYCLDGARLRLITATDTYGATNVKYRTELDQMVRVTSLASTDNIPGWFRVEMPNGLEYEYGNSTTSKLMSGTGGSATPQFWAVSKITDPYDNSIVFTYDTDATQQRFRPSLISYTERGGSGHYKISFVYQTTIQLSPLYFFTPSLTGGAAHKEDKLLDRIELEHDDVVYRAYKFTYSGGAGDNERLGSVQECAYAPSEDCLPATTFTWQSATAGHSTLASTSKAVASSVIPLDINGDGIEDLAWAASGTWQYMLGGASGFGGIQNTTVTATNPTKAMVLEWNGDGFDDVLIDWSDGKWRVLKGGANGFVTPAVAAGPGGIPSNAASTSWTVSDEDGDGRDDLLSMPLNAALTINVRYSGASGFGAQTQMYSDQGFHTQNKGFIKSTGASAARRPDFNGDGRFDLLVYACFWDDELDGCLASYRWYQMMSDGTSFTWEGAVPGATYNIDVRFGDFNADGLTDIVYPQATIWTIGFGQGSGGFSIVSGPGNTAHATYQTLVGDYDGDGNDDLYVTKNSPFQWEIFRSTGTALATTPIATSISGTGLGWMLQDQNGDSLPDIGRYASGTLIWSLGTHQGLPGERLLTATDGLANGITFSYLPMTSTTVYAKGTGAVFPEREFRGSAPLVRTMQISPAGGTSYTFTYKYANARVHGQGRSFLGMGQREITDSRNGIFTTEIHKQNFPFIGAPATVTVKQSSAGGANTIQSVTHTYLKHDLSLTAGNERYLPYRQKTVTNAYEVGGVRNGDQITQLTETHTVNTWGNSTFVSIDTKDMDALSPETGQIYRTEITSTFMENSTDWCIGPPLTRDEKRILPGGSFRNRSASWQVLSSQCHVTQETLEPGEGNLVSLITDIGHDACGNLDSATSYPAGQTSLSRETSIDYGSRCQRPETITRPEDHVASIAYDWPLAVPATQTDPNGLVTTLEHDGFGRLTRQLRPDGTAVRFALTACNAGNNWCSKASGGARAKVTRTERSTTDTVLRTDEQISDGIGRLRWTHTDTLESGLAFVETVYDALNRPTARTQPYFYGGSTYPTSFGYDLIGRISSINAPISESVTSGRLTSFDYEGRDLKVTDPENFITTRRNNVLEQPRAITDPGTGGLTEYAYHPFGEIASITDANFNVTSWTVNERGFVTGNSDPDSGNWTFEVNAFGETAKIRDAKTTSPAWTTQFTFDELSRPLTRTEAEGTTTFTLGHLIHNSASNKYIGHLKSVTSPGSYSETYTFDQLARFTQLRTTIEGTNYYLDQSYWGSTGLPAVLTYPASTGSRLRVAQNFQNQLLNSVTEYQGTTTYWDATSTDAWGHYQDAIFGNGVVAMSDFDQASGLLTSREAGIGGGTGLIDSVVDWADLRGNFTERQDLKLAPAVTETFQNDALSRFDYSNRNGSQNLDVTLDAIGNILVKAGQSYVYTGAQTGCTYYSHSQPRAVRKIGSTVYCYDANGNMTKRGGSTISYASYNLPTVINSGSNSSTLSYGAFRNRYKQVAVTSGAAETTIYVAGLFEKVTRPGGVIEYRHYIPGGTGMAAIHTRRSSGTNSTYYWHADHLGSPELLTDSSGAVLVRPSFGAYGERRDGTDWNGAPSAADLTTIGNITRRGFTGHEHLDSVGLIHMNGRVYDPVAGRFLGVDPILGIGLSQDVNSYSYVWNNPLSVIDPTGLYEATDKVIIRPINPFPCFTCSGYSLTGDALSEFLNTNWATPTLRDAYVPPPFEGAGPNAQASNANDEASWDGKSFGASNVIYGAGNDSTVGGTQSGDFAVPYDPPIEPVYPLENAALFFAAGGWNLVRGVYGIGRVAVTQLGRAVVLRWAFSAAERAIIREATSILTSSEFAALRAAHAAGESLTVNIGGRVVQYEAGWAYAEGMSLAEINGFLLGPRAFASPAELARTVAHELYRLQSGTLGYAEAGAYATRTTQAAFEFAQRAAPYLPGVP